MLDSVTCDCVCVFLLLNSRLGGNVSKRLFRSALNVCDQNDSTGMSTLDRDVRAFFHHINRMESKKKKCFFLAHNLRLDHLVSFRELHEGIRIIAYFAYVVKVIVNGIWLLLLIN